MVIASSLSRKEVDPDVYAVGARFTSSLQMALRRKGSVLYRAVPVGLISIVICLLAREVRLNPDVDVNWWSAAIVHPLAIQVFGILFAFLITNRITRTLARWWNGLKDVIMMQTVWHESFMVIMCYVKTELQVLHAQLQMLDVDDSERSLLNKQIDKVNTFGNTIIHWSSLSIALAFSTLKKGELFALRGISCEERHFDWIQSRRRNSESGNQGEIQSRLCTMRSSFEFGENATTFGFLGELSAQEEAQLATAEDPAVVVVQWIFEALTVADREQILKIPFPVQSRINQHISKGLENYHDAYTIAAVPFPFPLAQLSYFLMEVFLLIMPIIIEKFTQGRILAPLLSFLIGIGYWGLSQVADELENPFGDDANDLPLLEFNDMYNHQVRDTSITCLRDVRNDPYNHRKSSVHIYSDIMANCTIPEIPKNPIQTSSELSGRMSPKEQFVRAREAASRAVPQEYDKSYPDVPGHPRPMTAPPFRRDKTPTYELRESSPRQHSPQKHRLHPTAIPVEDVHHTPLFVDQRIQYVVDPRMPAFERTRSEYPEHTQHPMYVQHRLWPAREQQQYIYGPSPRSPEMVPYYTCDIDELC